LETVDAAFIAAWSSSGHLIPNQITEGIGPCIIGRFSKPVPVIFYVCKVELTMHYK